MFQTTNQILPNDLRFPPGETLRPSGPRVSLRRRRAMAEGDGPGGLLYIFLGPLTLCSLVDNPI